MAVSNSNSWNWADSLTQQLRAKKNSHTVRWYVLVLPVSRHGHYQGNPARALQAELDRRMRGGETLFEFFAPSYVEVRERHGQLVRTNHPLLYNYVFIHASESEIYRMKRFLPQYNFLPRIRDAHGEYYPYLSDEAMRNLRWVAESYSDVLPVYTPGPDRLMKGDRIRITEGQFKGVEATVIIQPGAGRKEVMVCVENCMYVPLLSVEPGQYEVVAECRQPPRLHATERRPYSDGAPRGAPALSLSGRSDGGGSGPGHGGAAAVRQPAARKRRHALQALRALLLPAYAILGDRERFEQLLGTIRGILPLIRAEQSRALLLVALYGCTNCCLDYAQAHAVVDPWRTEQPLKKSKAQLIRRLDDYDRWLGHFPASAGSNG